MKKIQLKTRKGYNGTIRRIVENGNVIGIIGSTMEMIEKNLFVEINTKWAKKYCIMYINGKCVFGENELDLLESEGMEVG